MENTLTGQSLELYCSLKDYFSQNALKRMKSLLGKYNQRRFGAAFVYAFEKVHIQEDGDWTQKSTRDSFIKVLIRTANSFSAKPLTEALTKTVKHTVMTFGEDYREEANDLLQDRLIALKLSKMQNGDIVKEFQAMRELTECANSYSEWAAAIQSPPVKAVCCCPFIQGCVKVSPTL